MQRFLKAMGLAVVIWVIVVTILRWDSFGFTQASRYQKVFEQVKEDTIAQIEGQLLQEYYLIVTETKLFPYVTCEWQTEVDDSNVRHEKIVATVHADYAFDTYDEYEQFEYLKEAYDDLFDHFLGSMMDVDYGYYLDWKHDKLAEIWGYDAIEENYTVQIISAGNTYVMDDSDLNTFQKNGVLQKVKMPHFPISSDNDSNSSHKTHKGRSSSKSSGWHSYDKGYDDVYFDGDYDEDRYHSDYEYATGVDDAMGDLDEDW